MPQLRARAQLAFLKRLVKSLSKLVKQNPTSHKKYKSEQLEEDAKWRIAAHTIKLK